MIDTKFVICVYVSCVTLLVSIMLGANLVMHNK